MSFSGAHLMRPLHISNNIDVVILCGGLGTRIRSEIGNNIPKCMADINGKPFLHVLIRELYVQGFRRFIFCTGYKSEVIDNYFSKVDHDIDTMRYYQNCEFIISKEDKPMGTAGAVRNIWSKIKSDYFVVMNGDTYFAFNSLHTLIDKMNEDKKYLKMAFNIDDKEIPSGVFLFSKKVWPFFPLRNDLKDVYSDLRFLSCEIFINNFLLVKQSNKLISFFDIGTPKGLSDFKDYKRCFKRAIISNENLTINKETK